MTPSTPTPPDGPAGFILTRVEAPVGWLVLNRPEKRNALRVEMWRDIPARIAGLERDPAVRVVVIRGAGDEAFAAGADIDEFEVHRATREAARAYDECNELAFRSIRECSKPTLAMVHGFCVGGGCALAVCADLRVASSAARFAITPAKLGLGYPFSGVEHVVRELGPAAARYIFLTGQLIPAAKALELGVVHEVHPPVELEAKTRELAGTLARNAPKTMRALKESVRQAMLPAALREPDAVERLLRECFTSEDYAEGRRAFKEKRAPKFEDR